MSAPSLRCCRAESNAAGFSSPWSNTYDPPIEDGEGFFLPSDKLRELEVQFNSVFDAYRELYFEGGVSSVYLWDLEEGSGFAGCFLIKKGSPQCARLAAYVAPHCE